MEAAAIDDATDDFAHVVGHAVVHGDDAKQFFGVVQRIFGSVDVPGWAGCRSERANRLAHQCERVLVVDCLMVGNAGDARVDCATAEVLSRHFFAGRGLHEWWAAKEDRAGALDDDRLVAHCRDVRTTGGTRSHHRGDLWDASL